MEIRKNDAVKCIEKSEKQISEIEKQCNGVLGGWKSSQKSQ
jgi:hypothetical protein